MSKINKIRRILLSEGNVGVAIRRLRSVLGENPFTVSGVLRQRLENLESDYQRMCDFMLNGYRDDQRDEVSWRIPWLEEPGRLQSMESQRIGHD